LGKENKKSRGPTARRQEEEKHESREENRKRMRKKNKWSFRRVGSRNRRRRKKQGEEKGYKKNTNQQRNNMAKKGCKHCLCKIFVCSMFQIVNFQFHFCYLIKLVIFFCFYSKSCMCTLSMLAILSFKFCQCSAKSLRCKDMGVGKRI
jgi:hypothetical protein